jgi:hypothetical protein
VQFDPVSKRVKSVTSYGNSYEILAALQVTAGAKARPEAQRQRFDVEACDDYIERVRSCMKSLDTPTREKTSDDLDWQIDRWQADLSAGMKPDQLERSCQAALSTTRMSLSASCPRVVWD